MLTTLWKCYSAVHTAMGYFLYGAISFFLRKVPPSIGKFFSTSQKSDDLEGGVHTSRNDSPTIVDNSWGSAKEDQAVISGEIAHPADPVPYEPHFNEVLSKGSTSLIARVKPGVVVKCPRYSWWHSKAADNHPFVKDIKRSFEVEERLLHILGTHPRIIRYANPLPASSVLLISIPDILVFLRNRVDYCLPKLATVTCRAILTGTMIPSIYPCE